MNQIQIDIIKTETIQTALKSTFYITKTLSIVPDLGCDKKIFSWNTAFGNSTSDEFFVLICRSGEGYVRFALVLPPEKIREVVEAIRKSGI